MSENKRVIPKDSFVMLSRGEYSDYTVLTFGKALEDIDIDSLIEEYLSIHPEQSKRYCFKEYAFLKWLCVDRKLIEELDYIEYHIYDFSITNDQEYYIDNSEKVGDKYNV